VKVTNLSTPPMSFLR